LKLLTQNFFSAISRLAAMSGNSKVILILKISQQQRMSILIPRAKTKQVISKGFCEYGVSKSAFFKSSLVVNKELYIFRCLLLLYNFIQKHKKKIMFWFGLASAHDAKDTLTRLEELKIKYVLKEENSPNVAHLRPIENF
jgi:hypothetical protein